MKPKIPLTLLLLQVGLASAFGQFFEGRIGYMNAYLNKETLNPITASIPETVTIKGGKYKIKIDSTQQGQLEWQIDNYYEGTTYSRKSYANSNYVVTDKPPTFLTDGKIVFSKPDTPLIAPILRGRLCNELKAPTTELINLDTLVSVNGLGCSVIVEETNGIKKADYYCYSGLKLDPALYNCNRVDGLDKIYKYTGGALIVQLVVYSNLYTYVYQIQKLDQGAVSDQEFEIPKNIKIIDIK